MPGPADAYYEWTGKPGAKIPHMIQPKANTALASPMAFAGLWEHWLGADGSELETMIIITVPANPLIASIHARMPAIVPPRRFADWLDVRGVDAAVAARLLEPAPGDVLEVVEVSRALRPTGADPAELEK
jgi:putative SOS response-associated peptidase YedK